MAQVPFVPSHFSSCKSPCRYRSNCRRCRSNCSNYASSLPLRICHSKKVSFETKKLQKNFFEYSSPASRAVRVQMRSVNLFSWSWSGSGATCRRCDALRPAMERSGVRRSRHSLRCRRQRRSRLPQLCIIKILEDFKELFNGSDLPGRELTRLTGNPEFK